jgi:secondary thiamine-phosphate synthase enzyme
MVTPADVECSVVEIKIRTSRRTEAVDITEDVGKAVKGTKGTCVHLFCLHTTCGLTVNENADPAVMKDIMDGLDRLAPADYAYRHLEGNSDAHIKSSLMGCSLMVPLSEGRVKLGTWQGIYLMEFDGPRERKVSVSII